MKSLLFVPASREDRFKKAFSLNTSSVIFDLEDTVNEEGKSKARENIARFAGDNEEARFFVRINSFESNMHKEDLKLLDSIKPSLKGIMLPKADNKDEIESIEYKVLALIESSLAVYSLESLIKARNLLALSIGVLDLSLDMGLEEGCGKEFVLDTIKAKMVLVSKMFNLEKPLNGVYAKFEDKAGFKKECERVKSMGFGGALCIHPNQVEIANDTYSPNAKELAWAKEILRLAKMHDNAVFSFEGAMVDLPVILKAKSLLGEI
ncbi:hypothetical protein BKH43_07805 [Helicobacter sp. 13S00401-1]|uniref:HpcH/HpaI aldolase/citrate lyase family protein n=1 Tax=Helicobacter sp. 13S00401-1 TaxID=1905758 RepID=UPI000BA691BE|nr:CoA ester lyase [Helicobacter sp. 13S00401-1]PAF48612.1 hypothetical protein BKH43_07805 [Helicobacter sp. 13S00401-1]